MGQGAFLYQFTAFFQNVQGMSAALAGVAFTPFVVGLLVGSFLVARLALRFGARRIIAGGFIVMGVSLVWMSFIQVDTSYWFLLVPITLIGFGFGLATPARTQVVLAACFCRLCRRGQHRLRAIGLCTGCGPFEHVGHTVGGPRIPATSGAGGRFGDYLEPDQRSTSECFQPDCIQRISKGAAGRIGPRVGKV
jgi:MFS family permease